MLSDVHELFSEMCHYRRLFIQSAAQKHMTVRTVSFFRNSCWGG